MWRKTLGTLLAVSSISVFGATLEPSAFVCDRCGYDAVIADFNGDGLDDLLSLKARELRFNVDGGFGPPVSIAGIGTNDAVQIAGDFNGDGLADVVAWNVAGPQNEGPARFLWGNGSGGFAPGAAFPSEHGSTAGEAIDYDGDGRLDLVLIKLVGRKPVTLEAISKVTFLHGNGDGTFAFDQAVEVPYGVFPDIGVADFNADGRRDLVLSFNDPYLYFYDGDATGGWTEPDVRFTGVDVRDLRVADVNGDRHADIIFRDWYEGTTSLTVLFGDGAGAFPSTTRRTGIEPNNEIVVGDLFPGGAAEIAYVSADEGIVALTAIGKQLQVIDRAVPGMYDPYVRAFRGRRNDSLDLLTLGKFHYDRIGARPVFTDGTVADARSAARRRSRVLRGSVTIKPAAVPARYAGSVSGTCRPIAALDQWSFLREGEGGLFVNELAVAGTTKAEAAIVGDQMIVRLHVPDGALPERRLQGTLSYSAERFSGYVRDVNDTTSCGTAGRLRLRAQRTP